MTARKILAIAVFAFLILSAASAKKTKLTIKNTLGADFDELGDYDLFTHTKETDANDETQTENIFAFGDRFQADLESNLITARARLELLYSNADEEEADVLFVPTGFVHFTPVSQLGLIAGNNFYKYFAIPSAYLAAADDTTKYGRLLTDSLGHDAYFGSDSVSLYTNGFAGGVTSSWFFGDDDGIYIKGAAGATVYPNGSDTEKAVDFGLNGGIEDVFDFGFTAHNVVEDDRSFGAFAGLTRFENLILNAGFYYNFTSSDYLPEERVSRSDEDEFKKQKTKYALGLSGGYNFKRFGFFADLITGLTNEYIGEIKYYDENGNLVKTDTDTIVRGGTVVKYKYDSGSGTYKAKRTDGFTHEGIPLYAQLRLTYEINDYLDATFNFKLRTLLQADNTTCLTFYPRLNIKISSGNSATAGIRLNMNSARYDSLSSISIPVSYTYKFKKKL